MKSQKKLITEYLESVPNEWVRAYDLRGKATEFGFLGHQADRRARELATDGIVEHRISEGYAEYRAKASSVHFPEVKVRRAVFFDSEAVARVNATPAFAEVKQKALF